MSDRDKLIGLMNEKNILLLGPYGECKDILIKIKEYLIEKGFKNTRIVEELPELDHLPKEPYQAYFLDKSIYYIVHWSDINLFHFTELCGLGSVIVELDRLCTLVPQKQKYTSVIKSKNYDFDTLVMGITLKGRIPIYEYGKLDDESDDEYDLEKDILEQSRGACYYAFENWLSDQ